MESADATLKKKTNDKKPSRHLQTLKPRKTMLGESTENKAQTSHTLGDSRERTFQKSEPRVEHTTIR
eukprot:CAMPEP_0170505718 /NCGR_PEP_ID=MMETSP0208-20121228/51996_1 /TAXON_ID=197538 /ORGANISM="Strombidium inclinatum, Strain S3" /LENGTH=66 /DNA_ID=CAMNT_0010786777 /DNA_START=1617 /DNA_END=1814 /DNA_ORIENTATION=+